MSVKMYRQFSGRLGRSSILPVFCLALLLSMLLFPASNSAQRRQRPVLQPATRNYFAGKIALIPRDARLQQARMLAQIADQDLLLPPSRLIEPAPQADKLAEWLKNLKLAETNGLIISLEALANREAPETPEALVQRLQTIKQLRVQNPKLPIYGFASLDSLPGSSAAGASKQICQTALDLVADGALSYLLIEQAEDLREKPAQIARARLIGEIASREIEDRVAFDDDPDAAAPTLLARLIARRFNQSPRVLPIYSSKEGRQSAQSRDTIALDQSINAKVKLTGGVLPVQESEAAPSVDMVLFVHTPQTTEAQRTSFAKTIAQTIERGARVVVIDLSGTKAGKEALLSELRDQKQLDKVVAYASSTLPDPVATASPAISASDQTREAASRALSQAVIHFTAMKVLRNDLDRIFRIDRAQVTLLFSRYLQDWAYNLIVRPKLDAFAREQKADPNNLGEAVERAEKFTFDQLQPIATELFDEQFRRNSHAILLNSGERAEFRISLLQRLQVRFASQKTLQAEIKQSIHTYYEGTVQITK